jgi:hypothetical protein
MVLSFVPCTNLPRQTLIVGQRLRLICYVDNILISGPSRERISQRGEVAQSFKREAECILACIAILEPNEFAAASVFIRKRVLTRA